MNIFKYLFSILALVGVLSQPATAQSLSADDLGFAFGSDMTSELTVVGLKQSEVVFMTGEECMPLRANGSALPCEALFGSVPEFRHGCVLATATVNQATALHVQSAGVRIEEWAINISKTHLFVAGTVNSVRRGFLATAGEPGILVTSTCGVGKHLKDLPNPFSRVWI